MSGESQLLSLPRELQDVIFRMVLVSEYPIETNGMMISKSPLQIHLLRVCRQIRAAASKIFWQENKFQFTTKTWNFQHEYNVLRKVESNAAQLIKHFTIGLQHQRQFRRTTEAVERNPNVSVNISRMGTRPIRNEIDRLLQYGVPASSIKLTPSPELCPPATASDQFLAAIHVQLNNMIKTVLEEERTGWMTYPRTFKRILGKFKLRVTDN